MPRTSTPVSNEAIKRSLKSKIKLINSESRILQEIISKYIRKSEKIYKDLELLPGISSRQFAKAMAKLENTYSACIKLILLASELFEKNVKSTSDGSGIGSPSSSGSDNSQNTISTAETKDDSKPSPSSSGPREQQQTLEKVDSIFSEPRPKKESGKSVTSTHEKSDENCKDVNYQLPDVQDVKQTSNSSKQRHHSQQRSGEGRAKFSDLNREAFTGNTDVEGVNSAEMLKPMSPEKQNAPPTLDGLKEELEKFLHEAEDLQGGQDDLLQAVSHLRTLLVRRKGLESTALGTKNDSPERASFNTKANTKGGTDKDAKAYPHPVSVILRALRENSPETRLDMSKQQVDEGSKQQPVKQLYESKQSLEAKKGELQKLESGEHLWFQREGDSTNGIGQYILAEPRAIHHQQQHPLQQPSTQQQMSTDPHPHSYRLHQPFFVREEEFESLQNDTNRVHLQNRQKFLFQDLFPVLADLAGLLNVVVPYIGEEEEAVREEDDQINLDYLMELIKVHLIPFFRIIRACRSLSNNVHLTELIAKNPSPKIAHDVAETQATSWSLYNMSTCPRETNVPKARSFENSPHFNLSRQKSLSPEGKLKISGENPNVSMFCTSKIPPPDSTQLIYTTDNCCELLRMPLPPGYLTQIYHQNYGGRPRGKPFPTISNTVQTTKTSHAKQPPQQQQQACLNDPRPRVQEFYQTILEERPLPAPKQESESLQKETPIPKVCLGATAVEVRDYRRMLASPVPDDDEPEKVQVEPKCKQQENCIYESYENRKVNYCPHHPRYDVRHCQLPTCLLRQNDYHEPETRRSPLCLAEKLPQEPMIQEILYFNPADQLHTLCEETSSAADTSRYSCDLMRDSDDDQIMALVGIPVQCTFWNDMCQRARHFRSASAPPATRSHTAQTIHPQPIRCLEQIGSSSKLSTSIAFSAYSPTSFHASPTTRESPGKALDHDSDPMRCKVKQERNRTSAKELERPDDSKSCEEQPTNASQAQAQKDNKKAHSEETRTICLTNLPFDLDEMQLLETLKQYGHVTKIYFIKHRNTGAFQGIAYVKFSNQAEASCAREALNKMLFDGYEINAQLHSTRA